MIHLVAIPEEGRIDWKLLIFFFSKSVSHTHLANKLVSGNDNGIIGTTWFVSNTQTEANSLWPCFSSLFPLYNIETDASTAG